MHCRMPQSYALNIDIEQAIKSVIYSQSMRDKLILEGVDESALM